MPDYMDENLRAMVPAFQLKKYALYDGPGIRTTVFLRGCPLRCWWCHNPELQTPLNGEASLFSLPTRIHQIMEEIQKDIIFFDQSGGGITFSGGEPLAHIEILSSLLAACKEQGIHTALDTCGYAEEIELEQIHDLVDLFLYDLKIINDDRHTSCTGVSNRLILDNLKRLCCNGYAIRVRIPLIPGTTDTEENLAEVAAFVASLENVPAVDLLPYNQLGVSKYPKLSKDNRLAGLKTQSPDELQRKQAMVAAYGLSVNIGGGQ